MVRSARVKSLSDSDTSCHWRLGAGLQSVKRRNPSCDATSGCFVGLPDRSFAIVISSDAPAEQIREGQALVLQCFEGATILMLGDSSSLELFEVDK